MVYSFKRVLFILVMKFLFFLFTTESTCFLLSTELDSRGGGVQDKAGTELGTPEHWTGGETFGSSTMASSMATG